MKNKKILGIILFLFILILGGAFLLYDQLEQTVNTNQLKVNKESVETVEGEDAGSEKVKAPDFTVYDLQGNKIRLSDYIGKPVVLNFWASWCGPCQNEMPDFQDKYLEVGEEVCFFMINLTDGSRETTKTASEFIKNQKYSFPVFYDTEFNAADAYSVYSLPTTYFIDRNGYFAAQATGAVDGETLQQGIDIIMEKN